jgi:hypothetical protein
MPIFEVVNYTYYNTDDLLKIFERVESGVLAHKGTVEPSYGRRWRSEGERLPLRVTFKDYTPSEYVKSVHSWQNGRQISSTEKQYVKENSRPSSDIRIVTPDHLWDTPVEALAATRDGNKAVPAAVLEKLVVRIGHLYDVNRWGRGDKYVDPTVKGLSLRIETSLANKIDKDEKARAARQRAMGALDEALYAHRKISEYATNLHDGVSRAVAQLRRAKVPLGEKEVAMEEAVSYVMEALAVAEQEIRAAKVGR